MTAREKETSPEEKKAILGAQKGDTDSFEFLYHKYHRGLYGYLLSMLKSPQAAEDLTQDIFVKLYRQIGSYRFQSPFSHWLFRSARDRAACPRNGSTASMPRGAKCRQPAACPKRTTCPLPAWV
jgi:hypothetical protein